MKTTLHTKHDENNYYIYAPVETIAVKQIEFLSQQKQFKNYPKDAIALALYLQLNKMRKKELAPGWTVCKYPERINRLRRNILLFRRENPEKNFEFMGLKTLIPLYIQAEPIIKSMLSKINKEFRGKKSEFLRNIASIQDVQSQVDIDLWRLWNTWFMRYFYPGDDDEIVEILDKKLGIKPKRSWEYFMRSNFFINGEEEMARVLKKIIKTGGY